MGGSPEKTRLQTAREGWSEGRLQSDPQVPSAGSWKRWGTMLRNSDHMEKSRLGVEVTRSPLVTERGQTRV